MSAAGFILSPRTGTRVKAWLAEGPDLAPQEDFSQRPRQVTLIKITAAKVSGYYACSVVTPLAGGTRLEPKSAWAYEVRPPLALEVSRYYWAVRSGNHTDAKPRFAVLADGEIVCWVRPLADERDSPSGLYWEAKLQAFNLATLAWTDVADVLLQIRSGNRFVAGEPYLATLNGEATEDGTVYPLFWASGNQRTVMSVCDDAGNPRCDAFFFLTPFRIDTDVACPGSS